MLSTLERDGSRRWLEPRLSHGRLLTARRAVAYLLIAIYTLAPWIEVDGQPLVLFDIPARRFTMFGATFLPTDTLLLALSLVGLLLTFFLATALVGRVWCGWACPQTVYMEFLFRPIERLFAGTTGRGGKPRKPPGPGRVWLRRITVFVVVLVLANTFIAYFVGARTLRGWLFGSPLDHPVAFFVVALLTVAMLFHFSYFREQLCILVCPYGRLQSVLLDESSLVVAYDAKRGEPRGKKSKRLPVAGETPRGDCVDCKLCVTTCPTGIDIRQGLQMECVNCTQCIDACNAVMKKVGRPANLIRYSSQRADRGEPSSLLRPRTVIYPLLIAGVFSTLAFVAVSRASFDAVLLRNKGQPWVTTDGGEIRNMVRLKLTNRGREEQQYSVEVVTPDDVEVDVVDEAITLAPDEVETFAISVLATPQLYVASRGKLDLTLRVTADDGDVREVECSLLGPDIMPRPTPNPGGPPPS